MGSRAPVKERKGNGAAPAAASASSCRHHWIIDSPSGALSNGRCKICGEVRQFRNSSSDYIWDDDSSSPGYSGWGSVRSGAKPDTDEEVTAAPAGDRGKVALAL